MTTGNVPLVHLLIPLFALLPCLACVSSPTSDPTPSASWLTLHWAGKQRELVPPLIFYVDDEDLAAAVRATGETQTSARLSPAEFHAITRWLEAHPPTDNSPDKPAGFTLRLGTHDTRLSAHPVTTPDIKQFLSALSHDIPIPETARSAVATFAKSYGI